jgi:hypothetical protein
MTVDEPRRHEYVLAVHTHFGSGKALLQLRERSNGGNAIAFNRERKIAPFFARNERA